MSQISEIIDHLRNTFRSVHEKQTVVNVLQLLMLKHLNDNSDLRKSAPNLQTNYLLPESARWDAIKSKETDYFESIPRALSEIERNNTSLQGVLLPEFFRPHQSLDTANIEKAMDLLIEAPRILASKASQIQFIDAIERVEDDIAMQQGRRADASTPPEISDLLIELINPTSDESVYDPFAGTGQLLFRAAKHLNQKQASPQKYSLSGQEINTTAWAITRMKLVLSGEETADFALGNVLSDPAHHNNKKLKKFDCVISNPPLGLNWKTERNLAIKDPYKRFDRGLPPASGGDLAVISHMLASLSQSGRLGVVTTRGTMHRFDSSIRQRLVEEDLLEGIINLPSNMLRNTGIPISIVIFNSKKIGDNVGKVFLINAAHLNTNSGASAYSRINAIDFENLVSTYQNKYEVEGFSTFVHSKELIENHNDWSVHRYVSPAKVKIKKLLQIYSQFNTCKVNEAITRLSINTLNEFPIREKFNTLIVMPTMQQIDASRWRIFSSYEEFENELLELSEHKKFKSNFYSVADHIEPQYLKIFFSTELGKLILEDAKIDSPINSLNHDAYNSTEIPIPDRNTQFGIIHKFESFEKITLEINKMKDDFSVNPVSNAVAKKLHNILEITEQLTQSDKIRNQVQIGETKTQEFKQTLEYCLREKKRADHILGSVLKTIAGFLNTKGGTLFVGVADDGEIPGVNLELDKFHRGSSDEMLLYLTNKIRSDLGPDALQYVDKEIHEVDGNLVLVVECAPSKTPVFNKKQQFFVRRPASTDELKGEDQMKYYAQRFVQ